MSIGFLYFLCRVTDSCLSRDASVGPLIRLHLAVDIKFTNLIPGAGDLYAYS